ncbi:hypothetical protein E2C01_057076 [Portunus trituberculatus]|uniref:Uncharacterized protein n=1 Tax=Portunus trituberculatus TaxID=210409 RepID=A0A5B7H2C8_PORTR|nr:hypothetical protein [Portunus trituberculatus]
MQTCFFLCSHLFSTYRITIIQTHVAVYSSATLHTPKYQNQRKTTTKISRKKEKKASGIFKILTRFRLVHREITKLLQHGGEQGGGRREGEENNCVGFTSPQVFVHTTAHFASACHL